MEGHIQPIESWTDFDDDERELFSTLRDTEEGERLILDENFFVETILPAGVSRKFSIDEMEAYREPFKSPQSRFPILQWIREIPIDGHPADVTVLIVENQSVLLDPNMPTLVLHGVPGALIGSQEIDWCLEQGRSLNIEDVGEGTHFLPEDQPATIGDALVRWLAAVRT
ncbi:hypothetical protein QMK17_11195 [Rhodococcus sp. G-MC3]|uniref:hypothetical protein n=1 Tax=Rhodococcus sp. G-MC3 TaxID=3046209 RepID=UPI0024B936C0|nr:hypothetical protein [Rhodococcus sp. G-MC3]MDJ0393896.1 hypothetical protein [Rhodococcus sp. G-MC3]